MVFIYEVRICFIFLLENRILNFGLEIFLITAWVMWFRFWGVEFI